MAINPLGGAPGSIAGAGTPQKIGQGAERFGQMMKAQPPRPPENAPIPVNNEVKPSTHAVSGQCRVEGSHGPRAVEAASSAKESTAAKVLDSVAGAQRRMDQILQLAESGKSFSPAELLSLQAHVYRASQELDLAGKVVEKATGGVKQILQTQV
jgi:hypothetical protein